MTAQELPEYKALRVGEVFDTSVFYTMPHYQRGYAWLGDEQVAQLLQDLHEGYVADPNQYYILGQVIVSPSTSGESLDVVDGQQRLTTLFLFLIASSHLLAGAPLDAARDLKLKTVPASLYTYTETNVLRPRLTAARSGNDHVMALLQGQDLPDEDLSETQERIRESFEVVKEFVATQFETPEERFDFMWHVLQKVVLLRLRVESSSQALSIFSKINNRGLGLDDADLLKNLLFAMAPDDQYDALSNWWDSANDKVFKSRLKRVRSMEFLMKALAGIASGKSIPSSKVFDWWKDDLNELEKCLDFARDLPVQAQSLSVISHGKSPDDRVLYETHYGSYFFKWVQHFEVLLAGRFLGADSYDNLAQVVENRVILSLYAGEKNQDFERIVHRWSAKVAHLHTQASLEEVLDASSDALVGLDDLFHSARNAVLGLSYDVKSHRHKMRYVIARAAQAVEVLQANNAANIALPLKGYMTVSSGPNLKKSPPVYGFDLDHVFPTSSARQGDWKGSIGTYAKASSIGNLVLLHSKDNRSQRDALPWDSKKVDNLAGSELLINKVLCDSADLGRLQKRVRDIVDALHASCPPDLANWGPEHIDLRATLYWELFSGEVAKGLGHVIAER